MELGATGCGVVAVIKCAVGVKVKYSVIMWFMTPTETVRSITADLLMRRSSKVGKRSHIVTLPYIIHIWLGI